jgi:hypothetical protein
VDHPPANTLPERPHPRPVRCSSAIKPASATAAGTQRRSGRVSGDMVLSDLSDQGVADEDVVDQFIASPIFAAEALGALRRGIDGLLVSKRHYDLAGIAAYWRAQMDKELRNALGAIVDTCGSRSFMRPPR